MPWRIVSIFGSLRCGIQMLNLAEINRPHQVLQASSMGGEAWSHMQGGRAIP
jgi:hypothetical protein